jgi:hypothetical protein
MAVRTRSVTIFEFDTQLELDAFASSPGDILYVAGDTPNPLVIGGGGGTTDYTVVYAKPSTVTANSIIHPLTSGGAYTQNMGWIVPRDMTLKELYFTTGSSSAAASEDFTVSIRKQAIGIGVTGSGTQQTVGGGTLVTSLSLASGGALGSTFYRNQVATGLSVALTAGDVLFCEVNNFAFWAVEDLLIQLRCEL